MIFAFGLLMGTIWLMSVLNQPIESPSKLQWHRPALASLLNLAVAAAACLLLWLVWTLTALPVSVTVDGLTTTISTHRRTPAPLLSDLGLTLYPEDRLSVPLHAPLKSHQQIRLDRARPVRLLADGRDVTIRTWAGTPRTALEAAGIGVADHDQVVLGGRPVGLDAPLPKRVQNLLPATYARPYPWEGMRTEPLQLRVYRSIPITVDDGNVPFTIHTTAQTVGEALLDAEITLYLGDRVMPGLGGPVSTGMRVFIQRSKPVSLQVDGELVKTRTRGRTVGDALTEMGVTVAGLDQVAPPLTTEVYDNAAIRIVRIQEEVEVTEEIDPFETVFRPDPNLLIDTQRLLTPGAEGITRSRYRVRFEDGVETERTLEDRWQAQEPAQRVIAYGQRVAPQNFTAADGQILTYWRKVRMSASSYSAGTSGVSPDAPWYGITRTGEPMRHGVVAVDPSIIPLRSRVYVPGYGFGDALDTGSAIRSRRIDLGYDDSNLVLWRKWVDVYLLWPPPPAYQITWVLPNWPIEPK